MSRSRLLVSALFAALTLALPSIAQAGGPERSHTSFTYTLADAVADYRAFGDNSGDCGGFVLLVDYHVERDVSRWPDREVRHVHYTGHVHSSVDTSRSLVRNGDFKLTFWLGPDGAPTGLTRTGVFEYVVIDGHRINTHVGRDAMDLATGSGSQTPRAGDAVRAAVCNALR